MASPAQLIRRTQRGVGLSRFLGPRPRARGPVVADLGPAQRAAVASTFIGLVEGLYAHLPLKRSMYAIDPVQRLRLLLQRAERIDPVDFHYEMAEIVTGLRDAHTRYVGPTEFEGAVAILPFLIEAYGPTSAPHYVVSKMAEDTSVTGSQRYFRPGVEIRTWNAVPMDRAVDRHADDETGGRPDARRARALESMTLRALQFGPPPDEQWVDIGYVDLKGRARTHRIEWRVVQPRSAATSGQGDGGAVGLRFAIDPAAEVHRRVKKLLFKPRVWYQDLLATAAGPALTEVPDGEWIPTTMQDALAAKVVTVRGQRLGYLRLWSFDVADDAAYLAEVIRLLALLPGRGLIVDLRSNPGGLIWAAERLFQLFTPNPVSPNGFSLLATSLTREMAAAPQNSADLTAWQASLDDAVATGELYSSAVPITPEDRCNDIGQVYGGPVVAIVDPNTYSAGDLFAAGFVDNRLGPLVSVGEATGGGGANVWSVDDVTSALLGTAHAQQPLPAGIGYTMSVRRATRSGAAAGAAIEDVGVRGDYQYAMTRRDLTDGNADLLSFAGRLVLGQRRTDLSATVPAAVGSDPFVVRTLGVDQLDVVVDDAFQPSRRVTGRTTKVAVPAGWTVLELRGSAGGELVQRRVLRAGG
jgi:Peptidase family S41